MHQKFHGETRRAMSCCQQTKRCLARPDKAFRRHRVALPYDCRMVTLPRIRPTGHNFVPISRSGTPPNVPRGVPIFSSAVSRPRIWHVPHSGARRSKTNATVVLLLYNDPPGRLTNQHLQRLFIRIGFENDVRAIFIHIELIDAV